jgi:putative endonuclease
VGDGVFQICSRAGSRAALICGSASPTCHARRRSVSAVNARQDLGRVGEQLAAEHLIRRGFEIVECNYRTRWGELDIVAFDGLTLAFCEVKTRHGGQPLEAIRGMKRSRVRKMAVQWLLERTDRPYAEVIRLDAIGVTFDAAGRLLGIEHLEGAF